MSYTATDIIDDLQKFCDRLASADTTETRLKVTTIHEYIPHDALKTILMMRSALVAIQAGLDPDVKVADECTAADLVAIADEALCWSDQYRLPGKTMLDGRKILETWLRLLRLDREIAQTCIKRNDQQ